MSQLIEVDSLAFVREKRLLEGELPLSRFERLHDQLAEVSGSVSFSLAGQTSPQGRPQLLLQATAGLVFVCQRCLENFVFPLALASTLELVRSEAEAVAASEEALSNSGGSAFDEAERDFIVASKTQSVLALLEDEIILALPAVPKHQNCALPASSVSGNKILPFAALKAP